MQIPGLSANIFASVLPQALTGSAARTASSPATFEPKTFESDLQSRDLAGAQSFLSTLQLGLTSAGIGGATASAQIQKVSTDLTSGDLNAAQTDFSHLKLIMAQPHTTASASSNMTGNLNQLLTGYANSAAFASYHALQQDDVNRFASSGVSSLSVNV
ncbi:MAG TPA: hypothetical protein VFB43_08320 [Terracidiphilus sp.]|nr:hypothetical protein [Terracidiphilus sp.]